MYLFHNGTIRQPPIQCFILLTFLKSRLLEKSLHMTDDFNSFLSVNPSTYYCIFSNMYCPRYKWPVVLSNWQYQLEFSVVDDTVSNICHRHQCSRQLHKLYPIIPYNEWSVTLILKPQNPQNVRLSSNYVRLSIIIITKNNYRSRVRNYSLSKTIFNGYQRMNLFFRMGVQDKSIVFPA